MKELLELAEKIECSLYIELNGHKSFYEPADTYYTDRNLPSQEDVEKLDFDKDIWTLQFYPTTPIGHYYLVGNDLDELIKRGLDIMKELEA